MAPDDIMPRMLRRLTISAPYLIASLAVLARLLPTPRTIDDAFITFRYARNLLAGHGFVYNLGEHVLGTTTPLYTLLLAGLACLLRWENYPWLALLVNSLADGLTCLLLVALGQRLSGRRAVGLAAALLWAVSPMSVTFAIGGMETSVFILLLAACAWLYLDGRTRLAALAAGLCLLTRPDGLLLIAPLAADQLLRALRARRLPLAEAGLLAATLAPWAIFAFAYFGSPVPHSLAAKSLAYRLAPEAALVRLLQHYGTPFFEDALLGPLWPLAGLFIYLALSGLGGLVAMRRKPRAWPLALFPWLYFAAYSAANPLIFRWYLAPPLPFYYLFILTGLSHLLVGPARAEQAATSAAGQQPELANPAAAAKGGWTDSRAALFALPVIVFLLLLLQAWTLRPDHGPTRPAPAMAWHQLELYYSDVGQALAPRITPDTVVAAGDVGALGYYSNARILDTVGLMSPEASGYFPLDPRVYVINYAVPAELILDYAPDFVVLLEVYVRAGLLREARFAADYRVARTIDTDIYGSRGLMVWERVAP